MNEEKPPLPYSRSPTLVPWPGGMPEGVKMETVEDLLRMQQRVIEWLATGRINARATGSINNSLRTLLGYHANAAKIKEMEAYFQRIKALLDREADEKTEAKPP